MIPTLHQTEAVGALAVQVGGGHYKNLKLQPVEIAMQNGFDPCTFAMMKYIMRHGDKNGMEDLKKAVHFIDLRQATLNKDPDVVYPACVHTAQNVCEANGYTGHQAAALGFLWDWFYSTMPYSPPKMAKRAEDRREQLRGALYYMQEELDAVAEGRVQNEMDEARIDAIGQNGNDGEHYNHLRQRFESKE